MELEDEAKQQQQIVVVDVQPTKTNKDYSKNKIDVDLMPMSGGMQEKECRITCFSCCLTYNPRLSDYERRIEMQQSSLL